MSKIISFVAAGLFVIGVGLGTETASARLVSGVPVYDLHLQADMKSMPVTQINDQSLVFPNP
jgi:hypothetical protein